MIDYDKAIEIDPKSAQARKNRGYARFLRGEFERAAVDLSSAIELKDDDIYAILFRYLARSRVGEDATSKLEASAGRLRMP